MIKEVQEFYKDTYQKLRSKDEPQRETLRAIHMAVGHLCTETTHPSSTSLPGIHTRVFLYQAGLTIFSVFLIPTPVFSLQLNCCGITGVVEQFISDICPKKQLVESFQVKVNLEATLWRAALPLRQIPARAWVNSATFFPGASFLKWQRDKGQIRDRTKSPSSYSYRHLGQCTLPKSQALKSKQIQ